jgi:hypothetical protein
VVKGPWTAVVRGHLLTLRDPATHTAIVQRIESSEPGRFSVVEAPSAGTASFGCTNIGEYSFDRTASGSLHVQEVADSCEPRVEVLIAGVWTGPLVAGSTTGVESQEPSPSISQEPSPTSSFPDESESPAVDATPAAELQNTP